MKKSIIIAALLVMSFGALQAQRDTLGFFVNTPWYFKDYPFEGMRDTTHHGTSCTPSQRQLAFAGENSIYSYSHYRFFHNWNRDIAFGFYPDTTIHVIGVACVAFYSSVVMYTDVIDEIEAILRHEHHKYDSIFCRLYIPNGNNMQLVREQGLEEFNKSDVRLYYPLKDLPSDGSLSSIRHYSRDANPKDACFLEIYFDQEIDVSDSFYVSVKSHNAIFDANGGVMEDMAYGNFEYHNPVVDTFIYPPLSYRLLPDSANADDPWIYGVKRTYPMLFPIIRRDCDTCPHVQGIEVVPVGNGQAFLRWQRGTGHIDWQVSYGLAGTAPDDGTIIEFTNPISNIISFNPDSHYVAYVRARCRFARYEWGPWSDPVSIHLGGSGIDEAALSGMVTLSPNPATDEVSIDSPVPMTLVEAYDEKGARILRQELNTQHSSLNTKTWPSGAYILRIHTQQGVATKRLTVMH